MTRKTYTVFSDPSHAWLRVKRHELIELGIAHRITKYSYQLGSDVYLEEDGDIATFSAAYANEYGHLPKMKESHTDRSSRIRTFYQYEAT